MYGRGSSAVRVGGGGGSKAPNLGPITNPSTSQSTASGTGHTAAYTLGAMVLVYIAWALLETHQRIRQSVEPKNIYFNLRTIVLVTFTVIIGINILRIALAKLAALGVPFADHLLAVVANS